MAATEQQQQSTTTTTAPTTAATTLALDTFNSIEKGLINDDDALMHEFEDIDSSPVTVTELRAWYFFGFACDPLSFSFAFFIPLICQGMSAGAGFEAANHSVPCNTTASGYNCVVKLGDTYIGTSSFYFYGTVTATIVQLMMLIGIGSIADHGAWRKKFLLGFSTAGAIVALMYPIATSNDKFLFTSVITVLLGILLGGTWVFVHSYLPPLARNHPLFKEALAAPDASKESLHKKLDAITNEISSKAFVSMYTGALFILVVMAGLGIGFPIPAGFPSTYPLQIGVAIAGLLWLVGVVVVYKYLKERPGPPVPGNESIVFFSVKKVFNAFRKARQLRNLFTFLLGWFMFSDAFTTVTSVAVLWAQSQLGFTTVNVLILSAEVYSLAFVGAYLWNKAQRYFGLQTKTILLMQVTLFSMVPLWGCFALIPGSTVGYKQKIEIYIFGGVIGLLLGATQSTCRSMFSQLLPPGFESEFFSLYQITDKGASWVGPLVVGIIFDTAPRKEYAFLFVFAQFIAGFFFFSFVNLAEGSEEGKKFGAMQRALDAAKH
ncbi:Autophagy protein 22 [Chytriomyces hyalinus]|nr:Autophagy protein 22 [Chytriomyces hyalinus]